MAGNEWLIASKPLHPPFRDGSTVLVSDLISGLPPRFSIAYFGDPSHPLRDDAGTCIPASAMSYAPGFWAKARLLASIMRPLHAQRSLHFFFTPNPLSSRVLSGLRAIQRGRTVIQSLMSSAEAERFVPLLRGLDHVVTLSKHTYRRLVAAGLSPERTTTILPGTKLVKIESTPHAHRRILYAGDLDANVVGRLIAACQALPEGWRLCAACRPKGPNHEQHRDRLNRELATELQRGTFEQLGEVDDMDALLRRTSLQIYAADHVNNKVDLPLVLLEGMARGIPILCVSGSSVGEIFELASVHNLQPGLLAQPSPERVARAVREATACPDVLVKWGSAARVLVERELSTEVMLARYATLYDELARAR